jgi:protein O-GlcNAc transferase
LLRAGPLAEPATADHVRRMFVAAGTDPARLALAGGADHATFLSFYNDVDIALDPFPYSGGLTTLEALWMGVPVVTLAGATFAGRHSLSHLSNAGLGHLAAATPDAYVAISSALAGDLASLAELRAGLRARLRASPLLDAGSYTRALEEAFRSAWRTWCTG